MPQSGGLFWQDHGGAGPALLLSSGLGGSGSYWASNVAGLNRRCRVFTYDHRGTGRSDRTIAGALTVDAMADDMIELMNAIGLARATVIGHAAGGLAGLALALKAPERMSGLVVVNGWARLDSHTARCFDVRLMLLRDSGPRAYLHAQPLFLYPPEWISARPQALLAEEETLLGHFPGVEMMQRRIAAVRLFNIADRLGAIRVPTLCIASEDDNLVPPHCSADLAKGIAGAQCITMRGGHACNVTQPKEFNDLVNHWVYGD